MNKFIISLLMTIAANSGYAKTITFDNLIEPGNYGPNTGSGFIDSGFIFSENMDAIDVSASGDWWSNGVGNGHSGKFAAVNNYAGDMLMTKQGGGTFSVTNLWLNGWQGDLTTSTIFGLLNGNVTQTISASYSNPWQKFDLNFANIDSLIISGGNFLIDDIDIKETNTNVPEPASILLLGLGLIGLGLSRKKLQ